MDLFAMTTAYTTLLFCTLSPTDTAMRLHQSSLACDQRKKPTGGFISLQALFIIFILNGTGIRSVIIYNHTVIFTYSGTPISPPYSVRCS